MISKIAATLRQHRHVVHRAGVAVLAIALGLIVVGGAIRLLRAAERRPTAPSSSGTVTFAWRATLRSPVAGLTIDGNRLFVASDGMSVFPVSCMTSSGRCAEREHWTVPGGAVSAPLVVDERAFAGSSRGDLYAYPADCASDCSPEWVGVAGSGSVSRPVANFDLVYVTSDELYAFPVGCAVDGLECAPAWSADVPGRPAAGPPALGDGLVVVASSSHRGVVAAYPAVCGADCEAVWKARTFGAATSVAIGDGHAFTVSRGKLMAIPTSCTGRCQPDWRASLDTGVSNEAAASAPTFADGRVLVGGSDGRLSVFESSCDEPPCEAIATVQVATSPLHTPVVDGDTAIVTSTSGAVVRVDLACATTDTCRPVPVLSLGSPAIAPAVVTPNSVIAGAENGSLVAAAR